MTATAEWKKTLSSSARTCRTDRTDIVSQFKESTRKVALQLKKMGLSGNYQAKQDADRKLRDMYYSRWLSSVYPVVDLSHFTTERLDLLIRRTLSGAELIGVKDREPEGPTEKVASVRRYAIQQERPRALLNALPDPECDLGLFSFNQFQLNRERYPSYTGHVRCNRPEGFPKYLRKRLRDIAAIALESQAAAVRAGLTVQSAELSRSILWCPRVEDMYIREAIPVRDDPAILVMSGGRAHLIGFWDSPNENPIEGVLREFSEGSFENVVE